MYGTDIGYSCRLSFPLSIWIRLVFWCFYLCVPCIVSESFTGPTLMDSYTAITDSNALVSQYTRSQLQGRSESLHKRSATTTLFNPRVHNWVTERKSVSVGLEPQTSPKSVVVADLLLIDSLLPCSCEQVYWHTWTLESVILLKSSVWPGGFIVATSLVYSFGNKHFDSFQCTMQ